MLRLGAVLAACAALVSCRHEAVVPALPVGRFHVAIVVLDACRPDKIGCYGFDRPTSPELDALARDPDTVLFRQHYAQAAWTKPSVASLFTGLYAHQHGVFRGYHPKPAPGTQEQMYSTQVVADTHLTFAERMKRLGYRTFAVVKSEHLNPRYGFGQGFDEYWTPSQARSDRRRVERFLDLARSSPGPFFGYVHLLACHYPFPPRSRDAEYMERFSFDYDEAARREAGVDFTGPDLRDAVNSGKLRLQPDDIRFLNLVYEARLRRVDRTLVASLLEGLRESGLYDQTLLIVTADHGEELGEHGGYAHGQGVWDEIVRVPLLVKFPRGRRPGSLPREVDRLTREIDLLPAVLDLAGSPVRAGLPGVPIFRGVFPEVSVSQAGLTWALVSGPYKLIAGPGAPRLYHLPDDPGERTDIAAREPERVKEMTSRLVSVLATGSSTAPVIEESLSREAEANLRALGYLH